MIPRTLEQWSIDTVRDLLIKGYYESEYFDFKEQLPRTGDHNGKKRLIKTCCAFANGMGGFLVFGISDNKQASIKERLVGIDPSVDFPEHFGNYPHACSPSVEWDFKNPAISLDSGNVIHVVHIMKSWNLPHAYGDQNNNWTFPKRTNKGDEQMNFDEIRMSFLGYYEKRLKLNLLKSELQTIQAVAQSLIRDESKWEKEYSVTLFSTTVLESVLSETYIVLAQNPPLLSALYAIRTQCHAVNQRQSFFLNQISLPTSAYLATIRSQNEYLNQASPKIVGWCTEAQDHLGELLIPS